MMENRDVFECTYLSYCPFFNDLMQDMPNGAAKYKREFCLAGNPVCARFIVLEALGCEHVPFTLFPHQLEEAMKIIKKQEIS